MRITWQQRINQHPNLADISNWPTVNHIELKGKDRRIYLRNYRIVEKVLNGDRFKNIAHEFNLSVSSISRLLNRVLGGYEDEEPALSRALIPNQKIHSGDRVMPLSKSKSNGSRGAFNYILDQHPEIKNKLHNLIKAFVNNHKSGQNLTPKSFHKYFIAELKSLNWPDNLYPFDQDKLAYETCRKYFHEICDEMRMPKFKEPKAIKSTRIIPLLPYQKVQLDSQVMDINVNVTIDHNGVEETLRLSRLSLFLMKDVASDCILSYFLCLTKDPNLDDLLSLFGFLNKKWKPMNLKTPGLKYTHGACFPSGINEDFQYRSVGIVQLDNALCHLANKIKDYVLGTLHATLNYGLPANPKGRSLIEYGFKLLNETTHRFPSTTGSSPIDPIKETKNNLKTPPQVSLRALEEVLSVVVTDHNVRMQERLKGCSPIEYIKQADQKHPLRINFVLKQLGINPFLCSKKVTVRWYKNDNRPPQVSFLGLRYVGEGLKKSKLTNKQISIKYDRRDLRYIEAFTLDGKSLGLLKAPLSWQSHPFSERTKKRINKLTRDNHLRLKDPLKDMLEITLIDKHKPKKALEVVRLIKEYNSSINTFDHLAKETYPKNNLPDSKKSKQNLNHTGHLNKSFEWSTNLFRG